MPNFDLAQLNTLLIGAGTVIAGLSALVVTFFSELRKFRKSVDGEDADPSLRELVQSNDARLGKVEKVQGQHTTAIQLLDLNQRTAAIEDQPEAH